LDIGKKDLKACMRTPGLTGRRSRRQEIRTFATTTNALLELRQWLLDQQVTLVNLEATGDYWRGVYYLLEDTLNVILGKRRTRQGPARSEDGCLGRSREDSSWLGLHSGRHPAILAHVRLLKSWWSAMHDGVITLRGLPIGLHRWPVWTAWRERTLTDEALRLRGILPADDQHAPQAGQAPDVLPVGEWRKDPKIRFFMRPPLVLLQVQQMN